MTADYWCSNCGTWGEHPTARHESVPHGITVEAEDFLATWKWGGLHYTQERSETLLSTGTRYTIQHESDQRREQARDAIAQLLPLVEAQPVLEQQAVRLRLQTAKGHAWDENQTVAAVMELARPEALVKAEALREAAEKLRYTPNVGPRAGQWLRERADKLEGK